MGVYTFIYNIFSYPFGYLINLFYNLFGHNYLMAVIMLAVLIKLLLLPTSIKTQKNQATSRRMRARIDRIKEKYKDDQQKQQEAMQEFYKKEGFGSMGSGCGALLIQFPVIIGLFGAIYYPLTYVLRIDRKYGDGIIDKLTAAVSKLPGVDDSGQAARFIENTIISRIDEIQGTVLNLNNGSQIFKTISEFNKHFTVFGYSFGDIPKDVLADGKAVLLIPALAFIAAMASSIYSLIRTKRMGDSSQNMATMGCMMLFMPFFSLWLAYQFPVGIGIYWAVNSTLGVLQMVILDIIYKPEKVIAKIMVDESILRRDKELALKNGKAASEQEAE